MKWESVSLCYDCWDKHDPERPSTRTHEGPLDSCHRCGRWSRSGIYLRVDLEAEPTAEYVMLEVTQVRIESAGAHERVSVWVDGKLTGALTVGAGEGAALEEILRR